MNAPHRGAAIAAISTFLPDTVVTNRDLEGEFGVGSVARIAAKTGIEQRHVAGPDEFTSDLAVGAAEALFAEHGVDRHAVDFVLLCTQTPDHALPTTACIVADRLGLRATAGALDLGMGCSGYVYGLGMASGLIASGQAARVLLITADTYSKYLNPADRQLRTIFGDGAAATLLTVGATGDISAFVYGTDGSGAGHLVVPNGGLAPAARLSGRADPAIRDLEPTGRDLYMNGPEVFAFSLRVVPEVIARSLAASDLAIDDIDLFVFHQANAFMLETLRTKLGIEPERFVVDMADCGNTTSSSIPIALSRAIVSGRARTGSRVMLVGFGVGLSWAATIVRL